MMRHLTVATVAPVTIPAPAASQRHPTYCVGPGGALTLTHRSIPERPDWAARQRRRQQGAAGQITANDVNSGVGPVHLDPTMRDVVNTVVANTSVAIMRTMSTIPRCHFSRPGALSRLRLPHIGTHIALVLVARSRSLPRRMPNGQRRIASGDLRRRGAGNHRDI